MPLTESERSERRFDRMLATAKQYRSSTYLRRFVAPKFQEMIRAEAGACLNDKHFIESGKLTLVRIPQELDSA